MIYLILGIVWLGCGLLAAGWSYAGSQRRRTEVADFSDTLTLAVVVALGAISLLMTCLGREWKHGWLWPGRKP